MPRRHETYLEDILLCIERVERYTEKVSFDDFRDEEKTLDAVLFNLENIGEASKNLSDDFKKNSAIDWSDVAGFRDFIVHQYFRADPEIIWDIVENELPGIKEEIQESIDD